MRRSQTEIDSLEAIILAGGGRVAQAIPASRTTVLTREHEPYYGRLLESSELNPNGSTESSWRRARHSVSTAIDQLGCRPKWLQA